MELPTKMMSMKEVVPTWDLLAVGPVVATWNLLPVGLVAMTSPPWYIVIAIAITVAEVMIFFATVIPIIVDHQYLHTYPPSLLRMHRHRQCDRWLWARSPKLRSRVRQPCHRWLWARLGRGTDYLSTTANAQIFDCLLYTSDAADEEDSVDLGGRRIIKK